jgi:pyruvate,water dikinase
MPQDLQSEILESYTILGSEKINNNISFNAMHILRNAQEPPFVSVRSSATTEDLATASFAGQQESFLNVKGDRNVIEHIKKCFSSLYTPRAIYYRQKQGFTEGEALLAVVIQKMVDSEKSGVVFSKDPNSNSDNVVIEAVFGLGEGIVSGMIKPDHYVITKDLVVEDIKISEKKIAIVRNSGGENEIVKLNQAKAQRQVLSNAEMLEVANYALKLEEHYKKPQDIEFALEAGKVYIVQSRPITTLGKQKQGKKIEGKIILEGLNASPGIGVGTVRIIKTMADLPKIKKGDVLVTQMTNPDMVVAMEKSCAIVTDEGGITSHAAIVSREMGIPAVVGTTHATALLKEGMKITVDGFNGKVYEGEVAEEQQAEIKKIIPTERVKLKVILDIPDYADRAAQTGITSVGLLRLEGIIASSGKHPLYYEKQDTLEEYKMLLAKGIQKIAEHFQNVWIRTSDIRTDEFSSLQGAPEKELNPMLGFHGIRFSLKHPKILLTEIAAIKESAEKFPEKRFGVMFPQIISMEEVKKCKEYFDANKTDNMEFGVMIETPAAVQIIEDISNEVNFISFGTNDLTQFTLAVDRGEDNVQYLYNELHPAIFSQIKKVIDVCRRKKVETSICGQAGSKKEMVEFLVRKGISSISVNADAAYDVSLLIKSLDDEHAKNKEEMNKTNKQPQQKPVQHQHNNKRPHPHHNHQNHPHQNNHQHNNFQKKQQEESQSWGKKGSMHFDTNIYHDREKNDRRLLTSIPIQAEMEGIEDMPEENIGPIEPFNDLQRITKESESIHRGIEEDNTQAIEHQHEFEANIKVEDDTYSPENNMQKEIGDILTRTKDFDYTELSSMDKAEGERLARETPPVYDENEEENN